MNRITLTQLTVPSIFSGTKKSFILGALHACAAFDVLHILTEIVGFQLNILNRLEKYLQLEFGVDPDG